MSEQLPANWTDEETGLACAVIVGPLGALNGYVAVAPSHPWFKVGYSEQLCDHEGCWEHDFAGDVERPFAYVKNEVQALARQLAAVTPETGRA